jgi:hypothetical protein
MAARQGARRTDTVFAAKLTITAVLTAMVIASPAAVLAMEDPAHDEHAEHGEALGQEIPAGEAGHHSGRSHKNEFAVFLGATDEHGHDTEFTWGVDYKRRITDRWAVGGLFDYAGGELRNAVVAATVTWFPIGHLQLWAGPGVEFHQGRNGDGDGDCGCGGKLLSDEGSEHVDKDATYFLFRVGVGWDFRLGGSFGIVPAVNLDFVNDEEVWVYGLNFTYGF